MKTKTLNQLWAQIERIRAYFDNPHAPGQAERLNRACEICNRYGRKAWQKGMAVHNDFAGMEFHGIRL